MDALAGGSERKERQCRSIALRITSHWLEHEEQEPSMSPILARNGSDLALVTSSLTVGPELVRGTALDSPLAQLCESRPELAVHNYNATAKLPEFGRWVGHRLVAPNGSRPAMSKLKLPLFATSAIVIALLGGVTLWNWATPYVTSPPTVAATSAPAPSASQLKLVAEHPEPTVAPAAPVVAIPQPYQPGSNLCGAPPNPWNYTYCGGLRIQSPPTNLCSVFDCIPTFWRQTHGYVLQCTDGLLSHSGGIRGSCSGHGGNSRPLYAP
jgi:hypothetical protein